MECSFRSSYYKIFVENNGQEEVATAPDGFTFDKDSRLDLNNEVKLLEGTHKYIVRAYNSKGEVITSGEVTISGDVTVEETTEAPTNSGETTPVVDDKEQTIDLAKIIDNKEGRQARYVRVLMTEKAFYRLMDIHYMNFRFMVQTAWLKDRLIMV